MAATLDRVQGADTLTPTDTDPRLPTDEGDEERFAHYCRKEDVARAYVTGEEITALCGKRWVPSRDPTRYPICPRCKSLREAGLTFT